MPSSERLKTGSNKKQRKKVATPFMILETIRDVFHIAPRAAFVSTLSFVVDGIFPALQAILLAGLFDSAGSLASGNGNTIHKLVFYSAAYILCFAFRQLVRIVSSVARNTGVRERIRLFGRMKIAEKASRLSLDSYEDPSQLDYRKRAETCVDNSVFSDIFTSTSSVLMNSFGLISVTTVLASYDLLFVAICAISVLPNLFMRIIRGQKFYRVVSKQAGRNRKVDYLWTLLTSRNSIKELRVTGCDEYLSNLWREIRDDTMEEKWDMQRKDAYSLIWCDILKVLGYGCSLLLAFSLVMNNSITIGLFGACISTFLSLQNQTKHLLMNIGNISALAAYASDYYKYLLLPEEKDGTLTYEAKNKEHQLKSEYHKKEPLIEIAGVSFNYPNAKTPALKDINLSIESGEKLVILGENGSGKTTLTKIILGLYQPNEGRVLYDGITVSDFQRKTLLRTVSIIAQDFVVYKLTLRENVAISDIERLSEGVEITQLIQTVGLADVVEQFGIDSRLGREFNGIELSGGQLQRLAIARGMFRNSDLVILDEPTSALDPIVETEILSSFLDIIRKKTAIIISHRTGICRLVDRLVVMEEGRVVETGCHKELISAKGRYYQLYSTQEQWYRE